MPDHPQDPFEEGKKAACENIPAEGNPYPQDNVAHAQWEAGHAEVAGSIEAGESEST